LVQRTKHGRFAPVRNERGVTLIEVLAASAILAFVVLAVVQLSGYNLLAMHKSDRTIEAHRAAEQVLNRIRSDAAAQAPYSHYDWSSGFYSCDHVSPACSGLLPPQSALTIRSQPFNGSASSVLAPVSSSRQATVQAIVNIGSAPRLVTVTVQWEGGG
jgi:prepilin-type N-terminal cleavage/methylation domain-containing protein